MNRRNHDTFTESGDELLATEFVPTSGEIDRIVGRRLRSIRKSRGLAQHQLASSLGISFQQLQKYESGLNRISASKLWQLGKLLSVNVAEFFGSGLAQNADEQELQADALEAAIVLSSITDPKIRASLIRLINDCAQGQ